MLPCPAQGFDLLRDYHLPNQLVNVEEENVWGSDCEIVPSLEMGSCPEVIYCGTLEICYVSHVGVSGYDALFFGSSQQGPFDLAAQTTPPVPSLQTSFCLANAWHRWRLQEA